MNETQLQKKCREYAEKKGWLSYKFASPGQRGVPDVIFLRNRRAFFVEFKNPNKKGRVSELQAYHMGLLHAQNFAVLVIDDFDTFCQHIDAVDALNKAAL